MQMIEAVIHQLKLREVESALDEMGIVDFIVTPVYCHGHREKQVMTFRGADFSANVTQKVKVEIISSDDATSRIIDAIRLISRTAGREDCRIGIRPYQQVI